jgi:transitional endoplasmic reticulum ATPase
MKISMNFPLRADGALARAAKVAAGHPSYRVVGNGYTNGSPAGGSPVACVELDLPDDWRALDDLRLLLRGEKGVEYEADGVAVSGEELFGGLSCFLRKQRGGHSAREWCTPREISEKQMFACKQIRVYDNDHPTRNSWYAFGRMGEGGRFVVDKEALTERVLSDLGPCVRCPILDLDRVADTLARLPEEIDPSRDEGWRYRGSGSPESLGVAKKSAEAEVPKAPEPKGGGGEGIFERFAKGVRSGSAGVVAASGAAPGSRNVPTTRYEDVGGMRETIALVREAVELPITHPEIFERLGIRPHRGILFHGPPGTGKTLLARAVAHETGAHFIAVSGPEILNKFWGQSEAKLRSIFTEARAKAPAIVLFDEIDSFASSRDAMSESFEATLVSQLLSLMDGMNDLGRVCVIATTNRPSALDPALRRPGRFDYEIEVGLPDAEARLHILKIHTKRMPTAPDLDLDALVALTRDYSGADIEALCREAAFACMRRSLDLTDFDKPVTPRELSNLSITTYDFRAALKRIGPSIRR